MRLFKTALTLGVVLVMALSTSALAVINLEIRSSVDQVTQNNTFDVTVNAVGTDGITNGSFHVTIPTNVEVTDVVANFPGGLPVVSTAVNANTDHIVHFAGMAVTPITPEDGDMVVVTISCTATALGGAEFAFDLTADNSIISDGSDVTGTIGVAKTVTIVDNNPPVPDNTLTLVTDEDTPAQGTLIATDADKDAIKYSVTPAGQGTIGTVVVDDADTGAYTYTPNENVSGSDTFTFIATDAKGATGSSAVAVTVTSVNDAPVAEDGTLAAVEDGGAVADKLIGTDVEDTTLTYSVSVEAELGVVVITDAATGDYTYTPNENANGDDSFTFMVTDSEDATDTAEVAVTVAAVNDKPVVTDEDQAALVTLSEPQPTTGTLVFSDVDEGDSFTIAITQGASGVVTVTDAATGAYEYQPNADATEGIDTFSFVVNDGTDDSELGKVTVTIDPGTHAVTLIPGDGGKLKDKTEPALEVDADGNLLVLNGANADLKAVASSGYYVSKIKVGDEVVFKYEEGVEFDEFDGKFTLEAVAAPVTVTATFERIPLPIDIGEISGGTVEPVDGMMEVEFGADKEFVVVPNSAAWEVTGVTVARGDGEAVAVEVDEDGFFTVEAIETSLTIVPTFGRNPDYSSADIDADYAVSISELLRVIQIYGTNGGAYHCYDADVDVNDTGEDGFASGANADLQGCTPANADYEQDWVISLSELLRVIQFVALDGYRLDVNDIDPTLDGFIAGKVE